VQQLDLGYATSSLALEGPERDGVRAGDRAPDAPVRGAAGQPTRLFRLFQGPHWTLLGYGMDAAAIVLPLGAPRLEPRPNLRIHAIGPRGDIVDDAGHVRDIYGVEAGDWVLVRPDGYVGAVVSGGETGILEAYMAAAGVR
jgi:hypothetical protein